MVDGKMSSYPLFETKTGQHVSTVSGRSSDIFQLGEGTNLYFKFLKYFMGIFAICILLSIPSLMINEQGFRYHSEENFLKKLVAKTTLGSIGPYMDMACSSSELPSTANLASYINFNCPKGKTMTGI